MQFPLRARLYAGFFFLLGLLVSPVQADELFPRDSFLELDVHNLEEMYQGFLASHAWERFQATPAWARIQNEPGMERFQAGRRMVERLLERDPVDLLLESLGKRARIVVWPTGRGEPGYALMAVPRSKKSVNNALQKIEDLLRFGGKVTRTSRKGVDLLHLEKGALAVGQDLLVLSSDAGLAEKLARNGKRLVPELFEKRPAGADFHLDVAALKKLNGASNGPPRPTDPGAIFFFGGLAEVLRHGSALEGNLRLLPTGFELEARLNAGTKDMAREIASLFSTRREIGVPEALDGDLLSLSLSRDLGRFWEQRLDLFPEQGRAKLAEAENVLSLFFSGPPDTVLAGLLPPLGLLVTSQTFDPKRPQPSLELPALALHAALKDPAMMEPRLLQAFQATVLISNSDRSKQGGTMLMLGMEPIEDGAQTVYADFAPGMGGGAATDSLQYNLRPTCTVRQGELFLGSAGTPIQRLLERKGLAPDSVPTDRLVLRGGPIAQAMEKALPFLVSRQMLEEGKSRQQATQDLETIIALAAAVDGVWTDLTWDTSETRWKVRVAGQQGGR